LTFESGGNGNGIHRQRSCYRGLIHMANIDVPIQLTFIDQAIDTRSALLKLDGVIIEMSAVDLLLVRNENNGELSVAQVSLRSLPTPHTHSVECSTFSAKFLTLFRLSLNKFHACLAFQSLNKVELAKLKRCIAELNSTLADGCG
jgi:hypothetical protein